MIKYLKITLNNKVLILNKVMKKNHPFFNNLYLISLKTFSCFFFYVIRKIRLILLVAVI